MTITVVIDPPLPSDSPTVFTTKAFGLARDLPVLAGQINNETQVVIPGIVNTVAGAAALATGTTIPGHVTAVANSRTTALGDIEGDVDDVDTAAGAAIGTAIPAAVALVDAAVAATAAGSATAAKVLAEAARDLSQAAAVASAVSLAAKDTIAIGRGLVTDGAVFWVKPNATDGLTRFTAYMRTSSTTQAFIADMLNASDFDSAITPSSDLSGNLFTLLGADNKMGLALRADGTLLAKLGISIGTANGLTLTHNADGTSTLSLGTVAGQYTSALGGMLDLNADTLDDLLTVVDAAGKVAFGMRRDGTVYGKIVAQDPATLAPALAEITAARGTRTDLAARLGQHLSPYGLPKRHQWGEWYMRETRQRLRKRLLGESKQLVIASIGDSWTHAATRWTGPIASTLKTLYGDAGPGWTGFGWGFGGTSAPWSGGNGNVGADVAVALSANWSVHYASSASPDICDVYSSTAGSKVTVTYSGAANTSQVNLHYIAGAGAIRYRWNAGAWTALDTSVGAGLTVAALAGMPAGAWTLEIENVSGTTTICGVDIQKTADGVRWHKLGATGSAGTNWVSANAAQWQAGLASLAPNLVAIMLATNDQAAGPTAFAANLQTLITRVKTAVPLADILLICPCENGRANTHPMTGFAAALYELAAINKCGFIDLQYVFGDAFPEYASTSNRPWFNADLIHPEPLTGGRVIVDAVTRFLSN